MKGSGTVFWQRLFYGLIALYTGIVLMTFSEYGITTDEPLHVTYGEHIAQWYSSFFRDHTVFTATNLWLYGGFFDVVIYVLKHVVPMDVYELRHLVCGFVGVLGVLGAYRIGCVLGGPRAGFLAALFLILTPRYYGHAFNNTKDIPFAVGYLWSLYYMIRCVGVLPNLSRDLIWKLGVVLGLTFGIRSSAALLVCYLGLFFVLRYVQVWRYEQADVIHDWRKQVLRLVGVGAITYATVFPFFPYMHIHPITGLYDSLTAFSKFPEVHYNFFEGRYVASNALPWYYIPKWFLMTLPEFVMVGLVVGLLVVVLNRSLWDVKSAKVLQVGLLVFAGLFPVVFGVVSQTPLLNGIRHLTFVVPPLVVVSALGVSVCLHMLKHIWVLRVSGAVLAVVLLGVVFDMVTMHPNQYVYFNRIFGGGLAEASTQYDTDYWNHTYKQGVRWIEQNAEVGEQKPVIGSLYKNVVLMVDDSQFGFTRSHLYRADYYLGNAWFDAHKAVAGDILHTIDVNGVPLLYVIRPDASKIQEPFFNQSALAYDILGDGLRADGDLDLALVAYDETLDRLSSGFRRVGIDSSGVLNKMGNVLLGLDRYEDALETFARIPEKDVFAGAVANNVGMYFIGKQNFEQALPWLERAVSVAPTFYIAQVSLGNLYLKLADTTRAVDTYRVAASYHTQNSDYQFELGQLLYSVGQLQDAEACFKRMIALKYGDVRGHYYSGLVAAALKEYEQATVHLTHAVDVDPDHHAAYQSLGTAYMYLENFEAASRAYEQALLLEPEQSDILTMLGLAQMNLKLFDAACDAFDKALAINPSDVTARRQRQYLRSVMGK